MQSPIPQLEPDDELADSVAHLQAAMEQVRQGKTVPLADALDAIARRHGLLRSESDR